VDESKSRGGDTAPTVNAGSSSAQPERDLPGALHEVSNALTVVLGWIESARELSGDASEAARALDIAATRARQARHIVRRAIGAHVPDEIPATLASVVSDAVVGLEPEARRAGLRLQIDVDPKASTVVVEGASSVLQILTNLILNAIAVSPHGGTVGIDLALAGGGAAVIGVADEGPGVAADRRATLMEAGISTRAGGATPRRSRATPAAPSRSPTPAPARGSSSAGRTSAPTCAARPPRPPASPPRCPARASSWSRTTTP